MTVIRIKCEALQTLTDLWTWRLDQIADPHAFAICASEGAKLVADGEADRDAVADALTETAESFGLLDVLDGDEGLQQLLDAKLQKHAGAMRMNGTKVGTVQAEGTEPVEAQVSATENSRAEKPLRFKVPVPPGEPVSGHPGRDRWMLALAATSGPRNVGKKRDKGIPPLSLRLTLVFVKHFNCRTSRLDLSPETLEAELRASRATVYRAIAPLKAGGWLSFERTPNGSFRFVLLIPPEERLNHV